MSRRWSVGETVYMGQSEENWDDSTMGAFGAFNAVGTGDITKSGEIWRRKEIMVGKSSPIMVERPHLCGGRFELRLRAGRRNGRGYWQEAETAGHDHACQPRVCRRQDLRVYDQRLARVHAHRQRREDRSEACDSRTGKRFTARRSCRMAGSMCLDGRTCIASARSGRKAGGRSAAGRRPKPRSRTRRRPRCRSCRPRH